MTEPKAQKSIGDIATLDDMSHLRPARSFPQIEGYEILKELGRGGMGVVYQARHLQLDRIVALKMIRAGDDAAESELNRFRIEAEAVARIQHPGIVQIFEIGRHNGNPFFSLEFCSGGNLASKIIQDTTLPPFEAAELVEALAQAVEAAHSRKVLHRDLKPANVLLTEEGQPKVTDFGLAKKLDQESEQTRSGAVIGTPSYMAPEQARGEGQELSPATDVYALGAILYTCLTGRPPFKGATTWETIAQVIDSEPVPPRQLQPSIPVDLSTICLKCLEKPPGKRYATARDLEQDLRRFLNKEPILARPIGQLERLGKWVRRRPLIAALLTALTVVTVGGFIGITFALLWALDEKDIAQAQTKLANEKKAFATQAAEIATEQRTKAEAQLLRAEWMVYASELRHAVLSLEVNNRSAARAALRRCRLDFRSWEHQRLWTALQAPDQGSFSLPVTHRVEAAVISANGNRVAVIEEKKVIVLDTKARKPIWSSPEHPMAPEAIALGSNGNRLVISSTQGTTVWDVAAGKEITGLKGPGAKELAALAFSSNGRLIAGGEGSGVVLGGQNNPREVWIWDAQSGEVLMSFRGHRNQISVIRFGPEDKVLVTGSWDRTVKLWDVRTGTARRTLSGDHRMGVTYLDLDPEGKRLVSAGPLSRMHLWNLETGKLLQRFGDSRFTFKRVFFSPDGKRIIAPSPEGEVILWNTEDGREVIRLTGQSRGYLMGLSNNGFHALLLGGKTSRVKIWSSHLRPDYISFQGEGSISTAKLDPSGKKLWARTVDGIVQCWSTETGKQHFRLSLSKQALKNIAFLPKTNEVVLSDQNAILFLDGETGAKIRSISTPARIRLLTATRSGDRIAWTENLKVHVLETESGRELFSLGTKNVLFKISFSPNGKYLALAGIGHMQDLRIVNGTNGKPVWFPLLIPGIAYAFSPDSQTLHLGDRKGWLRAWDFRLQKEMSSRKMSDEWINEMEIHPTGKYLVLRTGDKLVLWDLQASKEIAVLPTPGKQTQPSISADGSRLVTISSSFEPWIYSWDLSKWLP